MTVKSMLVKIGVDTASLEAGFKKTNASIQSHSAQFKKAGMAVTAVGGAVLGSLGMMVKGYVAAGDEVHKMAQRTGFSTEALSELKYAAEISGTSIGSLEKGVKKMSSSIGEARLGVKTYTDAFALIGMEVEELEGLNPEEQFMKMAAGIAEIEDPTQRAYAAQKLLGRAGTELLPLFAEGAEGMEELRQKARDMGISISGPAAEGAAELNDAMTDLKGGFKGVTMTIGATLAPIIKSLAEKITNIAQKVREWMEKHPKLAGLLTKVALAVGVLAAVLGPILMMLPALAAGFSMLLGPIGIVILVIAGLTAAGILVVKNWKKIKGFFIKIWQGIADFATNIFNGIKKFFLNWALKIADILAKIPIVKKLAGPWKESLQKMRDEMDTTVKHVDEGAAAITASSKEMGQAWIEAITGTQLFKDAAAAAKGETGLLAKGAAILKVGLGALKEGFGTTGEAATEAGEVIAEANEKIVSLVETMTDELKKATLDEYEYSKWALEQKLIERIAAIEAEKASEAEKNTALALARESYRLEQETLDKEHKQKEIDRQKTLTEKMKENWQAFYDACREQLENYRSTKEEIVSAINQATMGELQYRIWAFDQEKARRKAHIDETIKDEEKKAELLGLLDEEYRLKKELAHEEHAAKLTELEAATLTELTALYAGFISDTLASFADWGAGTKTLLEGVGTAFKNLAVSAIGALQSLLTQSLVAAAKDILAKKAEAIASVIASVMKSIPFPLNLVLVGGAIAAIAALFSTFTKFEKGGIAWTPQIGVLAEKEPELITPLSKVRIGGEASVGGAVTVRQYNYFYGDIQGIEDVDQISQRLGERTRKAIQRGRK